jgi:hypothetical protein
VTLPSGNSLVLTAGDIDEAVAGLLNNGPAASDVNGNTVSAGFTRIVAYRSGLINPDADARYKRFPYNADATGTRRWWVGVAVAAVVAAGLCEHCDRPQPQRHW